ncbi:MAG: hypothetical protein QCH31_10940 [Methanolobus sp.]|nr:hypothetical protein [Methanolobus sp.]
MYPEVFSANKEVRYYYLSLFGQLFMIFFAFNSILFEDAGLAGTLRDGRSYS